MFQSKCFENDNISADKNHETSKELNWMCLVIQIFTTKQLTSSVKAVQYQANCSAWKIDTLNTVLPSFKCWVDTGPVSCGLQDGKVRILGPIRRDLLRLHGSEIVIVKQLVTLHYWDSATSHASLGWFL